MHTKLFDALEIVGYVAFAVGFSLLFFFVLVILPISLGLAGR